MNLDRSRLNWGVFFIVLGAVPLAYHQGAVTTSTLGDAWQLWPLVLVGLGLGLVLSRTPAYFVGGLVVAACLGLVFGSLIAVGPQVGCGNGGNGTSTISRDGTFDGPGQVNLQLQCGSADVTTSSDDQWHVSASNSAGNNADVAWTSGSLTVRSGSQGDWWVGRGDDDWTIALPSNPAIALSVSIDAGDARLDLGGANLSSASFSLNAGEIHVDLSNARVGNISVSTNVGSASLILSGSSSVSGTISTNVGALNLCSPAGLGLRVRSTESLASTNFSGAGLVRVGDAWQTPDYDTAANKADLSANTSVGSLTLNPAGGCK
ncbi:MAG: DUF4097 family beta strand repeat-containing protein [Candidatus Limnocylindrales bacterium]|jgi:hypothetical protein